MLVLLSVNLSRLVSRMRTIVRPAGQCLVLVVVLRMLLGTVHRTSHIAAIIPQATPSQVWQFMADFSNYKLLNPHLIDWQVVTDSTHRKKQVSSSIIRIILVLPEGNTIGKIGLLGSVFFNHTPVNNNIHRCLHLLQGSVWNYTVRYSEYYEHIPLLTNSALANYSVYQDQEIGDLRISSTHSTCLLPGDQWCLTTTAENRFRFYQTGTQMAEIVNFSCPWVLVALCTAECQTQRTKVINNLQNTVFSLH